MIKSRQPGKFYIILRILAFPPEISRMLKKPREAPCLPIEEKQREKEQLSAPAREEKKKGPCEVEKQEAGKRYRPRPHGG